MYTGGIVHHSVQIAACACLATVVCSWICAGQTHCRVEMHGGLFSQLMGLLLKLLRTENQLELPEPHANVLRRAYGQALPADSLPVHARFWDECLLSMSGELLCYTGAPNKNSGDNKGSGCRRFSLVSFGCCHRRCTNLAGASEASLRLQKCTGCRLVRCAMRRFLPAASRLCEGCMQALVSVAEYG